MRSVLVALLGLCVALEAAVGAKMEVPPVKVRSTVRGAYDVVRSGDRIGREDFVRTVLSNNTVVYESVFEVVERDGIVVSGSNRLEAEEDSGFPRSYYTQRRTRGPGGETVRESTVEMYSNVAVVSERQDDREGRRVIALAAGALFVEGNTAHHLAVVLDRYDRDTGGPQSFRAFDPLGVASTDVTLKAVGDSTLSGVAEGGAASAEGGPGSGDEPMEHFRYWVGKSSAIDFFVDGAGRIVRIDTGSSELEYDLVFVEERVGDTGPDE